MPQELITKKLVSYLRCRQAALSIQSNPEEVERNKKSVEDLIHYMEDNIDYFCFGYALTYAAMESEGKREWWEAVLFEIIKCDEKDTQALEKTVHLPLSEQSSVWRKKQDTHHAHKLYTLFERLISYIIYHQASYFTLDDDFKQFTLLNHKNNYFNIVDEQSKNKKIHSSAMIGGYFELNELVQILDEQQFCETISIVANDKHAIHLSYANNEWRIYDPDDHGKKNLSQCFATKTAIGMEILQRLGHSLLFQVGTTNLTRVITFPKVTTVADEQTVLREHGVTNMMVAAPDTLLEILKFYAQNKNFDKIERAILLNDIPAIVDGNGWHYLAEFAPSYILPILKLITTIPDANDFIVTTMCKKKKENNTSALVVIAESAPLVIADLLTIFDHSVKSRTLLSLLLQQIDNSNYSCFDVIIMNAACDLSQLFQILTQLDNAEAVIKKLLIEQETVDNYTGLHGIADMNPDNMIAAIDCLLNLKNGYSILVTSLSKPDVDGNTPLHHLANSDQQVLLSVLSKIVKGPGGIDHFYNLLTIKNNDGFSVFNEMIYFVDVNDTSSLFCILLELAKTQKGLTLIVTEVMGATPDETILLHRILKLTPQLVNAFLKHMIAAPQGLKQITKAFEVTTPNNWHLLNLVIYYDVKQLPDIIKFIQTHQIKINKDILYVKIKSTKQSINNLNCFELIKQRSPQHAHLMDDLLTYVSRLEKPQVTNLHHVQSIMFSPSSSTQHGPSNQSQITQGIEVKKTQ